MVWQMTSEMHTAEVIAAVAAVTVFVRFLPFILFKNNTPDIVIYLGKVLPSAIMAMLVVYCLKGVSFTELKGFMPELISLFAVFVLYKLKHNTLLSILCGTVCYMLLVQKIFV